MRIETSLVDSIIAITRLVRGIVFEIGEFIAIKYYYIPGIVDSGAYEINLPYHGGGTSVEELLWKELQMVY